jgi:AsmA protein
MDMSRSTCIELSILAAVLTVLATPFLLPVNIWRAPIERAASSALGREVQIHGPLHLSIYPDIGLRLSDVSVANPAGSHNAEMITAGSVVVGARIAPLFSGRLEVTELTLQDAKLDLENSADGTPNWSFGQAPASGQKADPAALNSIGFSHLNLKHSDITWQNARTGKTALFKDVFLSLDMPDVAKPTLALPLTLDGSVVYNGERLRLGGRLENFGALLAGHSTSGRLSISSNIINADFEGMIGRGTVSGALKLGAHSVRSFAAWLGNPMPPGNGFGLVALEGTFATRDGVYSLRHAHLAFDSMNLNGDFSLDTKPQKLTLNGQATIDRIDVNPYLAPGASDDTVIAQKARAANPDAPLALSGLRSMDAQLTLVLGGLVLPHMKLDEAVVKANLSNGVLKAEMNSIMAFGGKGRAALLVDASGNEPVFHQSFEISGVKATPFFAELAGVKKISGTGALRFDISSHGNTPRDIVGHLDGKGEISLSDGLVEGADLAAVAKLLETVLSGEIPAGAVGDAAQTPFRSLSASFVMENGVMHSRDLRLLNPAVEIDGTGDVDFRSQSLEFHFDPKPAAGMHNSGIGVPFFVKGPWERPKFGADPGAVAKSMLKRVDGSGNPIEVLTRPGLSLKSLLGRQKPVTN